MQARGTLMKERRLIERMLSAVQSALAEIDSIGRVDPAFVDVAVDFVQTYADRTHHGKEEDKAFFPAARAYFTDDEDQAMLARFWAFDRAMIHEKYARVVAGLENR